MLRSLLCALAGAGAGCEAIATFNTSHISEDTDALCSDEIDNDGNGLSDCQDFGCLATPSCCNIPTLELEDTFDCPGGGQRCEEPCAPDEEKWQVWGTPMPVVCDGALSPNKLEQCYDVGVLSRDAIELQPGLSVEVTVSGVPEQRGRLEVGLTLQEQVAGGDDPCAAIDTVHPVVSLRMIAAEGGYRFVGRFDGLDLGASEVYGDGDPLVVSIVIGEDRRVHYAVGGDEFAVSPADAPIPESSASARLSLSGRGLTSRFEDVSVTVGTQCDAPRAWTPVAADAGLEPSGLSWDGHAVQSPALSSRGGRIELYYTGCGEKLGECDPLTAGVGRASAADGISSFIRDDTCPLVGAPTLICDGGAENPFVDRFDNLIDAAPVEFDGHQLLFISQLHRGREIRVLEVEGDPPSVAELSGGLEAGAEGAWDGFAICCPTVLVRDGQLRLYYAGRAGPTEPWQIGAATSMDGVTFTKDGKNPVLVPGAPGSFDEGGVGAPAVVFHRGLYRMWYGASGFFGRSAIGYAVSADGTRWHKLPGGPVLEPADLDLATVGSPAVLVDGERLIMAIDGDAGAGRRIYSLVNEGALP